MNNYQIASKNDYYTSFDKECACWANNHNGWRKAKKKWRKIGKRRIKRDIQKQINSELNQAGY